ncbi:hypothetical protein [Flavobacterium sp. 7A]|uniref:hypothetical protein n=1 Tax=Flavobacterium sp. 7A TaxID=2940571 RepID=UPI0022263193|nr:hypothetical protein [Flavobacterium sp. 7A]MCW2119615.1 hypothetical protein [Flavobacterium sp. 7A]
MKLLIKNTFTFFVFSILLLSCKNDSKEESSKQKTTNLTSSKIDNNYNISILLDLSDRISPVLNPNKAMEFYQRDLSYINSISNAFTAHIKGKKIMQMNDKIEVYFNPEPQNEEINTISKKLKFEFNKSNASISNIQQVNEAYNVETAKIYQLAIKDNNYIGSDIWRFFANNVNDYSIQKNHRNILIILTDGYMYHENTKMTEGNLTTQLLPGIIKSKGLNTSNWEKIFNDNKLGFIPANEDLSDLEILVLGLNPSSQNPYEGKVIKKYWSNWFTKMKVKRFEIKETGLPSNIDKVINDFITN